MTYATDADRYARPLPAPVRVEYRSLTATRWQPQPGVLAWNGETLVIRSMDDLQGYMLVAGAAWRVNGRTFRQRRVDSSGPVRLTLEAA
jgi:hypothetical protein